jgi:hypothetical protein
MRRPKRVKKGVRALGIPKQPGSIQRSAIEIGRSGHFHTRYSVYSAPKVGEWEKTKPPSGYAKVLSELFLKKQTEKEVHWGCFCIKNP